MSDRKQHWENVYRSKPPREMSWFQQSPVLSQRMIGDAGLELAAPIIDVGGGASRLVDRLCEAGYSDISVLDVSGAALNHAKKRLADKACSVQWLEQDIITFTPSRQYSLWHDRAVFHFLTDPGERQQYVANLNKALRPGGQLIIMAFAIGGPLKCSGLEIVQYDADKLQAALGPNFELVEMGQETHITPAGNQQKFAYFRLILCPDMPK